jgi:cysteinyl-tRNA synthetase
VDLDEYEKDNPRDFTLLKRAKLPELRRGIYTKTEWGNVRPSWHIESVAMAMKYLGETFDIYTSSRDLLFPHHENEIAISSAITGRPLARFWIHSELVLSEGKKAQAGFGGVPYVRNLLEKGYSGRTIRYWLLCHNYRKPLHFSFEALHQAKGALKRLDQCAHLLNRVEGGSPYGDIDQLLYDLRTGFTEAMDDDLDIAQAMASVFQNVRKINRLATNGQIDASGAKGLKEELLRINEVVNIFRFEGPLPDAQAQELVRKRDEARQKKDWVRADAIREELKALGVEVKDNKLKG